jgi:diguanylate cyclase (GGDEF)-like protein
VTYPQPSPALLAADEEDVTMRSGPQGPEPTHEQAHAELAALEMVPYNDVSAAVEPTDRLEQLAAERGWDDVMMRARLVRADIVGRRGRTAEAGTIVRQVHKWASERGEQHLLARAERLLSAFYTHVGDQPAALEHAVRALELLPDDALPRTRADHLMALAAALARTQSYDAARDRYQTIFQIADETDDVQLRLAALNNMAYIEYWAGDPQASMRYAAQLQLLAERHDLLLRFAHLDTVARAQMEMGQYAVAVRTLQPLLEGSSDVRPTEPDEVAEILLTIAEAQRMMGQHDEAQYSLEQAAQLCDERDLQEVMVRVMEEQALLYAAQGRYRRAFEQHVQFHEASQALYNAERDARARTLQAVFETEEALQSSRRFREMSLRDPLTGLYNRRYVDDRLPGLVGRSRDEGSWLSVALADLDHFKRVNDTLSHDVGDEVLRQLATLLQTAARDGFAARMGGEEFLLVLPGLDPAQALERCEQFRLDVADYPWRPLTGDVPVRISVGVVSTLGGRDDVSRLLSEADRRLYVSKRSGRNRVTDG